MDNTTKSKALDHEKTLIKPLDSSDEQQALKRPRKPSRKMIVKMKAL